jgi:hypothetical protein
MLYKYLPFQFAEAFVKKGEVLFRTLSYFRRIEHSARGDEIEGVHVDAPDHDVTLETNTGIRIVGPHRFLNSVDQERTYAFCCSQVFDSALFKEFDADSCVVITDPDTFFLRCATAARTPLPLDPPGLLHRAVAYFHPNKEAPLPVKDPRAIPFMKHFSFESQQEYRAVFARRGGFSLTQRIVKPAFSFADEIAAARSSQRLLRLGSLRGIAELRSKA